MNECPATCDISLECDNDGYTVAPVIVRIRNDHTGDRPWQVDGYRPDNRHYTEAVWNFTTWSEAIASVPRFIETVCLPLLSGAEAA